jgi:F0F1-type ATP synthase assembly protein I
MLRASRPIAVAVIDAFLWLRNSFANGSFCGASPLYPIIGLLIGALLYLLGLSLKYLFDRFYGQTPAARIVEE